MDHTPQFIETEMYTVKHGYVNPHKTSLVNCHRLPVKISGTVVFDEAVSSMQLVTQVNRSNYTLKDYGPFIFFMDLSPSLKGRSYVG